jgi:hypothetical protein
MILAERTWLRFRTTAGKGTDDNKPGVSVQGFGIQPDYEGRQGRNL